MYISVNNLHDLESNWDGKWLVHVVLGNYFSKELWKSVSPSKPYKIIKNEDLLLHPAIHSLSADIIDVRKSV